MSVPSPEELLGSIAASARVDVTQADAVLVGNAVSLIPVVPIQRALHLRRLSFSGTRVNTQWDGPFEGSFTFTSGVTALITDENLRGKTTILELITWVLRGSPRRLRADVKPWFERIVLEYAVNGAPMAVILTKAEGGFVADILRGDTADAVAAVASGDAPLDSVHVVAQGLSEPQFKSWQDEQMLADLRLDPMTNFKRLPGSEDGSPEVHTWSAYFGGVYLPPAGSDLLLGDTVMAGLPARILQMFCNVPLMSASLRVKALVTQLKQDARNVKRRADADAAVRIAERAEVERQLAGVRERMASLPSSAGRPYDVVVAELRTAERELSSSTAASREASLNLEGVRSARQAEERRVNNDRETALADLLFQGLSPRSCPRCEQSIGEDRTVRERDMHQCSVCTEPLPIATPNEDLDGGVGEEIPVDALDALRQAEDAASASASEAADSAEVASRLVEQLSAELAAASRADEFSDRLALQLEQARLTGRIESLPSINDPIEQSVPLTVLSAADDLLTEVTRAAALEVFEEINTEVANLARRFGVVNLDTVKLNRSGGMTVTTSGEPASFGSLSGGEKLRLRVALVVALLRMGHRSGVGSHPSLILLDSPGSEELTVLDESTLLRELDNLARELPDLQVVVASAEPAAVEGVLPAIQVYSAQGGAPLW